MLKPPSPTIATTCREIARQREQLAAAGPDVAGEPGRDRPRVRDDDRVVPELPADLGDDPLRLHRLVEA